MYSDTVEYMDLEWDGRYQDTQVIDGTVSLRIEPDATLDVDRTVPRKVRNAVNAGK